MIVGELFDGRAMLTEDSPRGEEMRHRSICEWNELVVAIIWTSRGEARRIISVRRARDVEKRAYHSLFGE
ncbi:MAG: BrnT family toxin [Methylobacteriaceae bacterium]|nr:BrnT family toxin [Methylobacteriaceae bacterium]